MKAQVMFSSSALLAVCCLSGGLAKFNMIYVHPKQKVIGTIILFIPF